MMICKLIAHDDDTMSLTSDITGNTKNSVIIQMNNDKYEDFMQYHQSAFAIQKEYRFLYDLHTGKV